MAQKSNKATNLPTKPKIAKIEQKTAKIDEFLKFCKDNKVELLDWQIKVSENFFNNKETFFVVPRQNGKTELMIWLALFTFIHDRKSVYVSTDNQKAWRKLRNRINFEINKRDNLLSQVLTHLNGMVKSPLTNQYSGSTLTIDNRTEKSATGDSYDYNFIDECQFVSTDEMASMLPTMATKDAKIFYSGTSPAPKYDFFIKMWQKEQDNDNFFYYGIPSEKDIPANLTDDKVLELVEKTNPSYPELIKKDSVLLEYKRLSKSDFIRERLGVIDDTTSNLYFNENKLLEHTFKTKDFDRACLGIYALGSDVALCLANRIEQEFYLQPLGIYASTDQQIFQWLTQRKGKIKEIRVSGNDYAIYDKWTKAFGTSKYQIMKQSGLYQRDAMLKDYWENGKLFIPDDKDSWNFLLDIQYENKTLKNYTNKDVFFSFDKQSNANFQAMANALFGANNFLPDNQVKKTKMVARW